MIYIRDQQKEVFKKYVGTSLLAQWVGVCLLVWGAWVRGLVPGDPTCGLHPCATTTEPACLEPVLRNRTPQ